MSKTMSLLPVYSKLTAVVSLNESENKTS